MTRKFVRARPATSVPGQNTETTIMLSKLPAAPPKTECLPVSVDPNDGGPIVEVPAGGMYTCPAGGGTTWPLLDNFTNAIDELEYLLNHISDSGHQWVPMFDDYNGGPTTTIEGNVLVSHGWYDHLHMPAVIPPGPEYDVIATFKMPAVIPVNSNQCGLLARYEQAAAGANAYFAELFVLFDQPSIDVKLFKRLAGVDTQIGATWSAEIVADQIIEMKLQIRDATKKVFVDNVERISSTDNAITAPGRVALFVSSDTNEIRVESMSTASA